LHCDVTGINHKGEGITRINGKVTFIPYAIPGEKVDISIHTDKKKYSQANLVKVLEPSTARQEPACPFYYQCGGCNYQHLTYQHQLQMKQQVVEDSLRRIGNQPTKVKPVIGMSEPWRYRNKVSWHLESDHDSTRIGFYSSKTHEIIPVDQCLLVQEKIETLFLFIKDYLNSHNSNSKGEIIIRQSSVNQKLMVILTDIKLVQRKDFIFQLSQRVDSLYLFTDGKYKLIEGVVYLDEKIKDTLFKLSPGSFFQVNPIQTERLMDIVHKFLKLQGKENILDAYCGTGSITLNLSPYVKSITGIESFVPAVNDAQNNALINNATNCTFISGKCERILPKLKQKFDAIILDPPRKGCHPAVIKAIAQHCPTRIIYVSCNPSTLARDLQLLDQLGYSNTEVQPIDMFPWTYHVECVVGIQKVESTK